MSDFKPRRCRSCNGTITPQAQGAVAIPTCDGCGEQWVTRGATWPLHSTTPRLANRGVCADGRYPSAATMVTVRRLSALHDVFANHATTLKC